MRINKLIEKIGGIFVGIVMPILITVGFFIAITFLFMLAAKAITG